MGITSRFFSGNKKNDVAIESSKPTIKEEKLPVQAMQNRSFITSSPIPAKNEKTEAWGELRKKMQTLNENYNSLEDFMRPIGSPKLST